MFTHASVTDDTIVAVSSPPGRSQRGLIRLSGPATDGILRKLLTQQAEHADLPAPRMLTSVRLRTPAMPALLARFPSPASYTGQDVAELQVPGHPALLDRLIHTAIAHGARLAQPGEFTFRGFIAGRFDLTQAEGIAATIAATSDSQLKAASLLRQGKLGQFASDVVDMLATQLALVEAGIDFVDQEDVVPIGPADLDRNLLAIVNKLTELVAHSRSWGTLEALPRVVFVGAPSTGKSTLFNALLGSTRAVISEMPGTTRDVLAEPMTITTPAGQRVEIMLVDIAGLDRPDALLDEQIQAAARQAIGQADLVLHVIDDTGLHPTLQPHLPPDIPTLIVRSKADLPARDSAMTADLAVSVHQNLGLDELRSTIARSVGQRGVSITGEAMALQPRHEFALNTAVASLIAARQMLESQLTSHELLHMELVAGRMREALDALTELGGQMTPDDVIGRIFATFCIGK